MTRSQVADAVALVAEAVSGIVPAHWGPVADVVAVVADTYARGLDVQELTEGAAA